MSNKPELLSVINALEFPRVGTESSGGYFSSSIENKEFQERAKKVWLPKVMENLRVREGTPVSPTMQQLMFTKEGKIVELQFLSAHLLAKHMYDTFDVYVAAMDVTYDYQPNSIVVKSGKNVYEADQVITIQMELHVDRVNNEQFLSVINLGFTEVVKTQDKFPYIPLGTYSGFYQLKQQANPHLYKAYSKIRAGKDLKLDEETMMYVTDEKKPKIVMSSLMYMLAYQNARFPDVRLLNVFSPPVRAPKDITNVIDFGDTKEEDDDQELMEGIEDFLSNFDKDNS